MTPIITASDMVARYTKQRLRDILDLEDTAEPGNDTRLLMAVNDANSEAEGYVRKQYPDAPIDPVPSVLIRYTSLLAIWNLLYYKEQNKSDKDVDDHTAAVAWFRDVAKGVIDLGFLSKKETFENLQATPVVVGSRGADRGSEYFGNGCGCRGEAGWR